MTPRFWLYKVMYDAGCAPCPHDGVLTLAICKPMIRAWAKEGDWIVGFGARSRPAMRGERLIYMAEVTQKLLPATYYEDPTFAKRPDCIYQRLGAKLSVKPGARFHEDGTNARTDIGEPPSYERANVLVSNNFRYLGAAGTMEYKLVCPGVMTAVERQMQGQRAFTFDSEVGAELLHLREELWRQYRVRIVGPPTEAGGSTPAQVVALRPSLREAAAPARLPKKSSSCSAASLRKRGCT